LRLANLIAGIVHRVLETISALWYGSPIAAFEIHRISIVPDRKLPFMQQTMMLRAQQDQILEAGLTAFGPVANVMRIHEALPLAARKRAATIA
jgi:hypothetical protein